MKKIVKYLKPVVCYLLVTAMCFPDAAPIVSYAADYVQNHPRYVEFSRPRPLLLGDVDLTDELRGELASEDTGNESDSKDESTVDSKDEAEEPEEKDESGDETDEKGQESEDEKEDETESGDKSDDGGSKDQTGDEDQSEAEKPEAEDPSKETGTDETKETTVKAPEKEKETVEATESEAEASTEVREPEEYYTEVIDEPAGDLVQFEDGYRTYEVGEKQYVTIVGGYSGLYKDEDDVIRYVDNTLKKKPSLLRSFFGGDTYQNSAGACDVKIPQKITSSKGIVMEKEGKTLELIPSEGNFKYSSVSDNAVRYSNVFENVDYQYTLVGNTIKEDIILMDKTDRNQFSFKIKAGGLKVAQTGDTIRIYESDKNDPLFVLEAPVMMDEAGAYSMALDLKLKSQDGAYVATVTADKAWLNSEDRVYPVRIDPTAAQMVPSEFIFSKVTQKAADQHYGWDGNALVGYDPTLGHCRTYVAINGNWMNVLIGQQCTNATFKIATMTDNSKGTTNITLGAPYKPWDANRLTWNLAEKDPELIQNLVCPGAGITMEYNITALMNQWISGTRMQAGFALRAEAEPNDVSQGYMPAEILYNRNNAALGPRLDVSWEGDVPTDLSALQTENSSPYQIQNGNPDRWNCSFSPRKNFRPNPLSEHPPDSRRSFRRSC